MFFNRCTKELISRISKIPTLPYRIIPTENAMQFFKIKVPVP